MKVKLIASTDLGELVCGIAARTCISETCPGIDDPEKSMKSLKQALNSHHDSVLEHWTATFQIEEVSRVTEIQLVRHRLASYSIQSGRYCDRMASEFIIPESISKAIESELMNGGGWGPDGCLEGDLENLRMDLDIIDDRMQKLGIPAEDRRYLYPQGIMTNIVLTMNARELRHFFGERCCTRAQWEIREMAEKMLDEVKKVAPVLFEDVGPKCQRLGYCPEAKGCGMTKERR